MLKLRNVKKVDYSYMDMPSEFDLIDLTNNFDKYGWGTSYRNYCEITDKYSIYENKDLHKQISEQSQIGILTWNQIGEKWNELIQMVHRQL